MPEYITHPVEVPEDEQVVGILTRKKVPPPTIRTVYSPKALVAGKEQLIDFIEQRAGEINYKEVRSLWDPNDPEIKKLAIELFRAGILDDEKERFGTFQDIDTHLREAGNVTTTKSRAFTRDLLRTLDQAVLLS